MLRFLVALTLVFVTLAPGAAQKPTPETVVFRFDWPQHVDARVVVTRYRERHAEEVDTTHTLVSYRMSVRPHPEGRLVTSSDFGVEGASALETAAIQEMIAGMVPSIVVDDGGRFVRIANVDEVQQALGTMFDQMADTMQAVREAIDRLVTREALTALSAQEWHGVVGFWAGAEFEIGADYEMEGSAELPFLPGVAVPMLSEIAVTGRVSCVEGGADRDCVEARVVSYPDPDAVAAAIQRMLERFAPGETIPFVIEALEMETEVILVADPATLLPYWYQTTKWVSGTGRDESGSGDFSQLDIRTYEYTYE